MATLTDRPVLPRTDLASKLTVGKRRVSVDALENLKTTSTTTVLRLCFSGSVLNERLAAKV